MYANIVFPIASFKSFIYKIPPHLNNDIHIGCPVNIPFKNKITVGYIESIVDHTKYKGKIYTIESIYKSKLTISINLWKTIVWMSHYYIAPLGLCIKSAIPSVYFKNTSQRKDLFINIQNRFREHSVLIMLTAGFTPIPYKIFTITSGINDISFPIFCSQFFHYG